MQVLFFFFANAITAVTDSYFTLVKKTFTDKGQAYHSGEYAFICISRPTDRLHVHLTQPIIIRSSRTLSTNSLAGTGKEKRWANLNKYLIFWEGGGVRPKVGMQDNSFVSETGKYIYIYIFVYIYI